MTDTPAGLADEDLPGLFEAADRASLDGQRRYARAVRLRLLLAVITALTGTFTWLVGVHQIDLAALCTAVALAGAVVVEVSLRSAKPEDAWYDGRALAESAKSLAWRFSVCAVPFDKKGNEQATERRFIEEVRRLLDDAPTDAVVPAQRPVLSPAMRTLRATDLQTRKAVYLSARIGDQQRWYTAKAEFNIRRLNHWRTALLCIELTGFCAAIGRATGYIRIDAAGVVAAVIAAGAAWMGLRQYATLARAYTFASNELMIARSRLELADDDDDWAREVADAEEAVSREHTMWRASRSRPSS